MNNKIVTEECEAYNLGPRESGNTETRNMSEVEQPAEYEQCHMYEVIPASL